MPRALDKTVEMGRASRDTAEGARAGSLAGVPEAVSILLDRSALEEPGRPGRPSRARHGTAAGLERLMQVGRAIVLDPASCPGLSGTAAERVAALARLRATSGARWIVVGEEGLIGAARRAGLRVVHLGPRPDLPAARVSPPDDDARDLTDAVMRILTDETFRSTTASADER